MSLTDYVVMPGEDYQGICDAVREQTETTDPIKSGDAAMLIRSIQRGHGAVSWNDLTDKPFDDLPTGGDTITWDGNTEGLESVTVESMPFYKVSDAVILYDDIKNGLKMGNGAGAIGVLDAEGVAEYLSNGYIVVYDNAVLLAQGFASVIPESPEAQMLGVSGGTYLFKWDDANFTTLLSIPGYTGFPSVKTLDSKYLPESGADMIIACPDDFLTVNAVLTAASGNYESVAKAFQQKGTAKIIIKCAKASYESVTCRNATAESSSMDFWVLGVSGGALQCFEISVRDANRGIGINAITV